MPAMCGRVKRVAVMHTLVFAVLQRRKKVLVWPYNKTSHAVQFGRDGTFVSLQWNGNLVPSVGLSCNVKLLLSATVLARQRNPRGGLVFK